MYVIWHTPCPLSLTRRLAHRGEWCVYHAWLHNMFTKDDWLRWKAKSKTQLPSVGGWCESERGQRVCKWGYVFNAVGAKFFWGKSWERFWLHLPERKRAWLGCDLVESVSHPRLCAKANVSYKDECGAGCGQLKLKFIYSPNNSLKCNREIYNEICISIMCFLSNFR